MDGVLVHAGALVNGTTIRSLPNVELGRKFTVYHIETEDHDLVVAEGVAAETFVDNVSRLRFDNHAEFVALYGGTPNPMEQLPQPRAMSRRQVPAGVKARIAAVASKSVPTAQAV